MLNNLMATTRGYFAFYGRFFSEQWDHMTPWKYGVLLISCGVFGWILMKTANKRT